MVCSLPFTKDHESGQSKLIWNDLAFFHCFPCVSPPFFLHRSILFCSPQPVVCNYKQFHPLDILHSTLSIHKPFKLVYIFQHSDEMKLIFKDIN